MLSWNTSSSAALDELLLSFAFLPDESEEEVDVDVGLLAQEANAITLSAKRKRESMIEDLNARGKKIMPLNFFDLSSEPLRIMAIYLNKRISRVLFSTTIKKKSMDKKKTADTSMNNAASRELFVHSDSNELLTDPLLNIEESESDGEEKDTDRSPAPDNNE